MYTFSNGFWYVREKVGGIVEEIGVRTGMIIYIPLPPVSFEMPTSTSLDSFLFYHDSCTQHKTRSMCRRLHCLLERRGDMYLLHKRFFHSERHGLW
jgi:hypothetical protein